MRIWNASDSGGVPPLQSEGNKVTAEQIEEINVDDLDLDLENPRFGLIDAADQPQALAILTERADLKELWHSINERGFERYEPIVAYPSGSRYVVVEGNRRLAAVQTLRLPSLLAGTRTTPPPISDVAAETTATLPVMIVARREDADDYIGFKHINGPSTWGSLAKAKFAVKLFEKLANSHYEPDTRIQHLSRRLGDSRQLILRSLVAYKVFEQAKINDMLDEKKIFDNSLDFSHLYTMLQNPATREYLGLTDAPLTEALVIDNPIPTSHMRQLAYLIQWLFGAPGAEPVIRRQGTDRPKLTKILASKAATETLQSTGDFDRAADEAGFRTDGWLDLVVKLATLSKNVADGVTDLPEDLEADLIKRARERLATSDRNIKGAIGLMMTLFPPNAD